MTETPSAKITVRCGNCLTLNRVPQDRIGSGPRCGSCKSVIEVPRQPVPGRAESFDRDVAYWPETLLVMFWSPWCLYCKIYDPLVAELARGKAAIDLDWGILRVDLSGPTVSASWNEKELLQGLDAKPATGRVGLATEGPGFASFDELVIVTP